LARRAARDPARDLDARGLPELPRPLRRGGAALDAPLAAELHPVPRAAGAVAVSEPRFGRRALFSGRGLAAALGREPARAAPQPLVGLLAGAPAAPARTRALPLLRPPGAADEADFLRLCTRC